jgi:dTDP-4-amino-4,6-dideoxygalactose transaminase
MWNETLSSSRFVGGPSVEKFEQSWAHYCGTRNAVGTASGTDAIELVLRGLGIGQGAEVVVPANTFIATAEAVVLAGATPRFVDVDPYTLQMTVDDVRDALNRRTAAVIAVGLYGSLPDMEAMMAFCDRRGLVLLEDAAQAHGASFRGIRAGHWGRAGCFSFYPGKNLGAFGDGGAVVTDDDELAESVRSLANHGRPPNSPHIHSKIARNSRLDALQAGVLAVKLPFLDQWNECRRRLASFYRAELASTGAQPLAVLPDCRPVYHQFVVQVENRDAIRRRLAEWGIETGIHYPVPCHLQGPYVGYVDRPLPAVESAARRIVSIPIFPQMTIDQAGLVLTALLEAMEGSGGRGD